MHAGRGVVERWTRGTRPTCNVKSNPQTVVEDFEKLLSFKSPFKLMLFDSYDDPNLRVQVMAELTRYLQAYGDHRTDEQYVVIDLWKASGAWLSKIAADGHLPHQTFDPITG